MIEAVCVAVASVTAAFAAWRGNGRVPVAWMERADAKLDDILDWQLAHDRLHRKHGSGGMQ